jgi:prepilin-type N-terminal cleavage/methylation domain-containing protein
MNRLTCQRGVTLVELMVAITAGLVVLLAGTSVLTSTLTADTANMRYTRLQQDLRSVVTAASKDLARAGEWILADDVIHISATTDLLLTSTSGAVTATAYQQGSVTTNNAFNFTNAANALETLTLVVLMRDAGVKRRYNLTINRRPSASTLELTIPGTTVLPSNKIVAGSWSILNPFAGVTYNAANNCVIARYDLNANGVRDGNENFGYRLNADGNAVETGNAVSGCGVGSTGWLPLTDPAFVTVSAFGVTQSRTNATSSNQLGLVLDEYLIRVTGTLVRDTAAQRTVEQAVKVRNTAIN